MSSVTKSYKAFSEEVIDVEYDQHPIFLRAYSPSCTFSETQSESRWTVAVSNFSQIGRGLGAGRSVSAKSEDLLEKDLEAMIGGMASEPHGHVMQMERYLLRLDEVLPHESSIAILIPAEEAVALEKAAYRVFPLAQKLIYISGVILAAAWTVFILRVLGLDYPDLFTHGLVLLVASTLVIVLAL